MRKKLSAIGNSLGIVIDKPILELLKIDRDTALEMTTDGRQLAIAPVRAARRARIERETRDLRRRHAGTLKKLAK